MAYRAGWEMLTFQQHDIRSRHPNLWNKNNSSSSSNRIRSISNNCDNNSNYTCPNNDNNSLSVNWRHNNMNNESIGDNNNCHKSNSLDIRNIEDSYRNTVNNNWISRNSCLVQGRIADNSNIESNIDDESDNNSSTKTNLYGDNFGQNSSNTVVEYNYQQPISPQDWVSHLPIPTYEAPPWPMTAPQYWYRSQQPTIQILPSHESLAALNPPMLIHQPIPRPLGRYLEITNLETVTKLEHRNVMYSVAYRDNRFTREEINEWQHFMSDQTDYSDEELADCLGFIARMALSSSGSSKESSSEIFDFFTGPHSNNSSTLYDHYTISRTAPMFDTPIPVPPLPSQPTRFRLLPAVANLLEECSEIRNQNPSQFGTQWPTCQPFPGQSRKMEMTFLTSSMLTKKYRSPLSSGSQEPEDIVLNPDPQLLPAIQFTTARRSPRRMRFMPGVEFIPGTQFTPGSMSFIQPPLDPLAAPPRQMTCDDRPAEVKCEYSWDGKMCANCPRKLNYLNENFTW